MSEKITIEQVERHRNGVGGYPFHVITFRDHDLDQDMVGIVFADGQIHDPANLSDQETRAFQYGLVDDDFNRYDEYRTAVFDRDLMGKGVIAFGENSWRGDNYHRQLVDAIREQS